MKADWSALSSSEPPLDSDWARYSAAKLRLHVVDEQHVNPWHIMPGFYRDPAEARRVAGEIGGKTFLSAQQV